MKTSGSRDSRLGERTRPAPRELSVFLNIAYGVEAQPLLLAYIAGLGRS